jgi:hypothetical protein
MAVIAEQALVRPRRRWVIHTVWLLISLGALAGGVALGFRWSGMAWAGLSSTDEQWTSMANARLTLDALESGDPAKLRHANVVILGAAVGKLAYLPRYADCRQKDRDVLLRARSWFSTNEPGFFPGEADLRTRGYTFCDRAREPFNFP